MAKDKQTSVGIMVMREGFASALIMVTVTFIIGFIYAPKVLFVYALSYFSMFSKRLHCSGNSSCVPLIPSSSISLERVYATSVPNDELELTKSSNFLLGKNL